jgi:peptide/nickel transport system ATP-binding protein
MSIHLHELAVTTTGRALVDVTDLQLHRGRPVTIVGESGSGKSLLAHAVMGTLAPELQVRGSMTLDGQYLDLAHRADRRRLWGRTLALLPQEPVLALDPTMRVGGQVAEGAATWRTDRRQARTASSALLARLGLGGEVRAFPHTLSGGMAQRVAFAAATIGGAPVLIADEPSKGLDELARAELAALLRHHVETDGVLLTITHDLDLARTLGGDVLVMKDALVVERGPADEVLDHPRHPYSRRLLAAEPSRWSHPWMRQHPTHTTTAGGRGGSRDPDAVLITGAGLGKSLAGKTLFHDLDITVTAGERLALTGPSGSGKTTLGNVLLRLLPPDTGRVEHSPALAGGRLQKLYQDPAQAFPARVPLRSAFGDVIRRHRCDPRHLDTLLGTLRLAHDLLARRPGQVSGGELQRLAIIRAVLLAPTLLFADEPTSRLDLITQEETVRCLMDQVDDTDCALVLVTHDQALATAVTGRRLTLHPSDTVSTGTTGSDPPALHRRPARVLR